MRESNDTIIARTVRLKPAGPMSLMTVSRLATVVIGLVLVLVTGASAGVFTEETVAERFSKAMKKKAEYCRTHKIASANRRCDILKLKPADPLATEEGRFAHSIKIPNPIPEDSGYRPGMTSEQYFDHLCKAEAGEFIYKTVENVDSVYQMRPRSPVNYESNHLYALEAPYGGPDGTRESGYGFVQPGRYLLFESLNPMGEGEELDAENMVVRYFGFDGHKLETMQKEFGVRKSRYGYTWRAVARPHDRELGIGGSELIVLDLKTNEVLAVHRGYAKFEIDERYGTSGFQWRHACPTQANIVGGDRMLFLLKVLKPISGSVGK